MDNWNNNDWQGRRKDQYETSAKFTVWSIIAIIIVTAIALIIK
jgi:uncharacterized membrane protein YidH (DUF202 family)